MNVTGLLHSAVLTLASARPGRTVAGRGLAALRAVGLRALLAGLLSRRHLGELLAAFDARGGPAAASGGLPRAPADAGPPSSVVPASPSGSPEAVLAALSRGPTTCLYRSLAGYATLRAQGQAVRFVIGVRPERGELMAHAWLEQGGAPVGEPGDPRERWAVAFVHPGRPRSCDKEAVMPTDQLRVNPDALLTELKDGSGVLLHLRTKFYFTLNQTGVAAWKLIAAGRAGSAEAVAEQLSAQFSEAPAGAVLGDVQGLLHELLGEGLLLPPRPGPPGGA